MLLKKKIPMQLGKIKNELALVVSYTILFEIFHHYFINIDVEIPLLFSHLELLYHYYWLLSPTRLMIAGGKLELFGIYCK
jgi:hypothetical protein